MLITVLQNSKKASRATCDPRVWDPCYRYCLANNSILSRYLVVTIKPALWRFKHNYYYCIWRVKVFINDFSLNCWREKNSLGQVITIRPVHCLKAVQPSSNAIATLSYSKFEIIPLQQVHSSAKPNARRKMFFVLEVPRTLTLPLLADSLQSVSSIKRMVMSLQRKNLIFSQSIGFCYLNTHGLKKASTAYARMARSVVPKLFWALPNSVFGEHTTNNNPRLKQLMKK